MFVRPSFFLANGTLVAPNGAIPEGLRIAGGRIAATGDGARVNRRDLTVNLDGAFVYPGLINAHDHLELNLFPNTGQGPYPNSYAWFDDINAHYRDTQVMTDALAVPEEDRLLWGGYRNLFSGVTTVAHHNPYRRRLFGAGFPCRVARSRWRHSLRLAGSYGDPIDEAVRKIKPGYPFIIHLAEGVDDVAAQELDRLDRLGGLHEQTVIVHGVGLTRRDHDRMAERKASLIWCPSSNLWLFGRTADIPALSGRIPIALATDSTLSGPATLFDELRVAGRLGYADPATLFEMATSAPARILGIDDVAGRLTVSYPADILVLPEMHDDPYWNLMAATPAQVYLVMIGGSPRFGAVECEPVFRRAKVPYENIIVEGTPKLVARGCRALLERLAGRPGITLPVNVEL